MNDRNPVKEELNERERNRFKTNLGGDYALRRNSLMVKGNCGLGSFFMYPTKPGPVTAATVTGKALPGRHFLAEEPPEQTLAELQAFLRA